MSERVHKYRAKLIGDYQPKQQGDWIPEEIKAGDWVYFTLSKLINGRTGVLYSIDWSTLGQFTTLLDKNGKEELYDGDVLSWNQESEWDEKVIVERTGVIEWADGGFIVQEIENPSESGQLIEYVHNLDARKIGDKYSNPELLQGGQS